MPTGTHSRSLGQHSRTTTGGSKACVRSAACTSRTARVLPTRAVGPAQKQPIFSSRETVGSNFQVGLVDKCEPVWKIDGQPVVD